jgi:hypothetical protein
MLVDEAKISIRYELVAKLLRAVSIVIKEYFGTYSFPSFLLPNLDKPEPNRF